MVNLDAIRDALDRLKLRLAAGELDEVDHDRLKLKLLEGLSESGLSRLGTTPQQDTAMVRLAAGYLLAGRYRVEERIGAGGMGVIYRVTDNRLKKPLAAKMLPPVLVDDPKEIELLEREVVHAQDLAHPNICSVINLETDVASGLSFVLMELLRGASLRQVLAEHGRLPEDQVFEIARRVYTRSTCTCAGRRFSTDAEPPEPADCAKGWLGRRHRTPLSAGSCSGTGGGAPGCRHCGRGRAAGWGMAGACRRYRRHVG
jgi:hypothetical protein